MSLRSVPFYGCVNRFLQDLATFLMPSTCHNKFNLDNESPSIILETRIKVEYFPMHETPALNFQVWVAIEQVLLFNGLVVLQIGINPTWRNLNSISITSIIDSTTIKS